MQSQNAYFCPRIFNSVRKRRLNSKDLRHAIRIGTL
jgi:hypothetical protein